LKAWRAKAMRFSVWFNSSDNSRSVPSALSSGYASTTTLSLFMSPASVPSAPASAAMRAASAGLAAAASRALLAPLRAAITASSVSRSCCTYLRATSTRLGIRS
jgi:hypothetical protein